MSERQPPVYYEDNIAPPPRLLRWFIWLLIVGVVLAVVGVGVGLYAFREWVPPRYQVVYSERFPILKVVLPDSPAPDTTLPTPNAAATSSIPLESLLGMDANATEDVAAPAATIEVTDEAAAPVEPTTEGEANMGQSVVMMPTETPNVPTATALPPTATTAPTLPPTQPPTEAPKSAAASSANVSAEEDTVSVAANTQPRPPTNARNFGFQYVTQTWNNCGPANVTVSLSYYGWREEQSYAESYLRGAREDKNVSPHEIVDFVNEQTQVNALWRIGGDMDTLKRLVAAGFPVMVELGYAPEGNDWLGHYQTVVGYDDAAGVFYVIDTYIPSDQGLPEPYREFDRYWQQFGRTFIVYYRPSEESTVMSILGDLSTEEGAHQVTLETAQREARANPDNPFAWFNIGKAQTHLGNYQAAATAFDQARLKGLPWRMMWYQFEPFEAYFETGRYSDVLALVESNETTLGNGFVEETWYWEGRVHEAQGDMAAAASSYRRALRQNSSFAAAETALARVS